MHYNINYDFETALELVKSIIRAYNLAVGTMNTDDSGYRETLTIFWMTISKTFLLKHSSLSTDEIYSLFLQSKQSSKNSPLEYYSKEILYSKKARKNWVNGDIKKIILIKHL